LDSGLADTLAPEITLPVPKALAGKGLLLTSGAAAVLAPFLSEHYHLHEFIAGLGVPLLTVFASSVWEAGREGIGHVFGGALHEELKGEAVSTISTVTGETIAEIVREFAEGHPQKKALLQVAANIPQRWAALPHPSVSAEQVTEFVAALQGLPETDDPFSLVAWDDITTALCRESIGMGGDGAVSLRLLVKPETVNALAVDLAAEFPTRIKDAFEEEVARNSGGYHQFALHLLVRILAYVTKPPHSLPMPNGVDMVALKAAVTEAIAQAYQTLSPEERMEVAALTAEVQALDARLFNRLREIDAKVTRTLEVGEQTLGLVTEMHGRLMDQPAPPRTQIKSRLPKPEYFTGREDELKRLRDALSNGGAVAVTQAISGLGGVGKTALALEYAHRHAAEYDFLLFSSADSPTSLNSGFRALADQVAILLPADATAEIVVRAVKDWLNANPKWLLILDNADFGPSLTPQDLKAFLPETPQGHILITSRAQTLHAGLGVPQNRVLRLGALPEADAIRLLVERVHGTGVTLTDANEEQAVEALAEELGYLPLALEQAAAYIQHTQSFRRYLALFRERSLAQLEIAPPETGNYERTVATTWAISVEAVAEVCPAAIEVLTLSAFLSPDAIPFEVVRSAGQGICPELTAFFAGAEGGEQILDRWDRVLKPLMNYSLVSKEAAQRTHSLHRLVQLVQRQGLTEEERALWLGRAVEAVNRAFPSPEFDNWWRCERMIGCALAVASHLIAGAGGDGRGISAAHLLHETAYYLAERGRDIEAEPLYKEALTIRRAALPARHPLIALTLNNLAVLYRSQGRLDEAEPLYKEALTIRRAALPASHADMAQSLNNLAVLYKWLGRYGEAEAFLTECLEIIRGVLPASNSNLATSLNNLADVYASQGRLDEAEPLYKEALSIERVTLTTGHPDIANTLNNLASLYESHGRYTEAEPLYNESLAILRNSLGEDHPNTRTVARNYNLYRQVRQLRGEAGDTTA
jgi:tetratricopeptide (TPR) repeat protein